MEIDLNTTEYQGNQIDRSGRGWLGYVWFVCYLSYLFFCSVRLHRNRRQSLSALSSRSVFQGKFAQAKWTPETQHFILGCDCGCILVFVPETKFSMNLTFQFQPATRQRRLASDKPHMRLSVSSIANLLRVFKCGYGNA